MLHQTIIHEDNTVLATRNTTGNWDITVVDNMHGDSNVMECSDEQWGAILNCMVAGDDVDEEVFEVAESCFVGVEPRFRLIP